MSFQENRFPILLGVTTAVVVGGLAYWGISSSGKYETAKENYDSAASEIKRLTSGPVYPESAKVTAREKAVSDYSTSVDDLQKIFDKFRTPKVENVGVDVFGDALREAREELVAKFEEIGADLPENSHLGLEVFTQKTVDRKNTGILLYQLAAFRELFGFLADAKVAKVHNIHRPQLPEESGKQPDLKGKSYRTHAIEITFMGREESVRQFLSKLDSSEKFTYVVRSIRIKNERQTAPNATDARFEQPKAEVEDAGDVFGGGGFEFPDEISGDEEETDGAAEEDVVEEDVVEEVATSTDSGQILKQVLGDELVEVFVRIDVIQFLDPKPLPKG